MDEINTLETYSPEIKKENTFNIACESRGKTQNHNEDDYFLNTKNLSFGVFDGMGGDRNGAESSKLCRDLIKQELLFLPSNISQQETDKRLSIISKKVNQTFLENKEKYNLGGTTGTFGIISRDSKGQDFIVGNSLGDSRAYLLRSENHREPLLRITSDDSFIKKHSNSISQFNQTQDRLDEAINESDLNDREKILQENRNAISNYFGDPEAKAEVFFIDLEPGDIILLTTDGVHDNLTTSEISQILSIGQNSEQITKDLINKSYDRSKSDHFRHKKDDMTALVIKVS